jgi:hypothetical protein
MQFSIGVLCLSIAALIGFHLGNRDAEAAPGCTYETACLSVAANDGGNLYVLRSDGVLSRFYLNDGTFLEFPHPAPAGRYIALERYGDNNVLAIRDDGAMFTFEAGSLNNEWTSFGTLPPCSPVATSQSTIGGVKAKYK